MKEPIRTEWNAEMEEHYERLHLYRRLYFPLRDKGLACFDDEGYMERVCVNEQGQFEDVWGGEVIRVCLEYYLEREWYDRCAILRDLQAGFKERYGDFIPKWNLHFNRK